MPCWHGAPSGCSPPTTRPAISSTRGAARRHLRCLHRGGEAAQRAVAQAKSLKRHLAAPGLHPGSARGPAEALIAGRATSPPPISPSPSGQTAGALYRSCWRTCGTAHLGRPPKVESAADLAGQRVYVRPSSSYLRASAYNQARKAAGEPLSTSSRPRRRWKMKIWWRWSMPACCPSSSWTNTRPGSGRRSSRHPHP